MKKCLYLQIDTVNLPIYLRLPVLEAKSKNILSLNQIICIFIIESDPLRVCKARLMVLIFYIYNKLKSIRLVTFLVITMFCLN